MSQYGEVMVMGAVGDGVSTSGYVRIMEWNNDFLIDDGDQSWVQRGTILEGDNPGDKFGTTVSLNSDGTVLAVGAINNDVDGSNPGGYVRIYQWQSLTSDGLTNQWVQLGSTIYNEEGQDMLGFGPGLSVSLSGDGKIIAIGAQYNDGNGGERTRSGQVRIYEWDGNESQWVQKGSDIDGDYYRAYAGCSVSLSNDGQVVAVGAHGKIMHSGQVRIYHWDAVESQWLQKGCSINGEQQSDRSGWSVSLSRYGDVVAVGSPFDEHYFDTDVLARIFEWEELR